VASGSIAVDLSVQEDDDKMKRQRLGVAAGMGTALSIAMACGPEPGKEREQIDHRIAPCQTVCESMQSPECGNVTHPQFPRFESVAACVQSCADPELENWWGGPQEDGTDACVDQWSTYSECVAQLSCEEQYEFWNAPRVSDYPCKPQDDAHVECGMANALEAG
jgi:hypothetical protein